MEHTVMKEIMYASCVGIVCYSKVVMFGIHLHCEDGHLVPEKKWRKQTNKQTNKTWILNESTNMWQYKGGSSASIVTKGEPSNLPPMAR